jgi:hypothetical protein
MPRYSVFAHDSNYRGKCDVGFVIFEWTLCTYSENNVQLVVKKTETVRIKMTHFCNFSIVSNLLTRDKLELTSKFNDIYKNYLIDIVK